MLPPYLRLLLKVVWFFPYALALLVIWLLIFAPVFLGNVLLYLGAIVVIGTIIKIYKEL